MWLGIIIFVIGAIATCWAYRQYDFRYDKVYFCDGVADNEQIQKAIDYAHMVFCKSGVYNVEATIELKNDVELNLTGAEPALPRKPCVLVRRLHRSMRKES